MVIVTGIPLTSTPVPVGGNQELWSETSLCHSSFDTPVNSTPLTSTPMTFNMSIEEVEEFCNDF